jgi:adenine-specific DNA methylase
LGDASHVTGIELDPVTARIARLLQPKARIINRRLRAHDLAASFRSCHRQSALLRQDRAFRPAYRSLAFRLHDYFIAKVDRLSTEARRSRRLRHLQARWTRPTPARASTSPQSADLVAAIRLPEGSFRADAGTDVVVDILFFRKRKAG